MRTLLLTFAFVASIVAAGRAAADDLTVPSTGYVYFHKPAARLAQHDSDLLDCYDKAREFYQPAERPQTGQQEGVLAILIGETVALNAAKPRGYPVNLENCMVAKGWSVVRLPPSRGAALASMPIPGLRRQLDGMVGKLPVEGEVVRVFENEALQVRTRMFEAARFPDRPSLSIFAEDKWKAAGRIAPWPTSYDQRGIGHSTGLEKLKAPTAGRALVILRYRRGDTLPGLSFRRVVNAYPESPFRGPDRFAFGAPAGSPTDPEYGVRVYSVLPGWWALTSASGWDSVHQFVYGMNFCLGAPTFDVKPGAIIFAGTFDGGGETLVPDMSMDGLKADLAAAGSPLAIDMIKPAAWVNGAAGDCYGYGYIYALEFPGAPFFEGYPYGSQASPRDESPAS